MKGTACSPSGNGQARTVVALLAVVLLTVVGCTATRGRRGEPEESGFLGNYSQLQKNPDYPAALVYVAMPEEPSESRTI